MNHQYLENNIFSHKHSLEDTTQQNSFEHMENEHYLFDESTEKTDSNFYNNLNNALNS